MAGLVFVGPTLEMIDELLVCDNVNLFDLINRHQIVQHVLHHWLTGDRQQRLRLIQRKRVKPRRIARAQND